MNLNLPQRMKIKQNDKGDDFDKDLRKTLTTKRSCQIGMLVHQINPHYYKMQKDFTGFKINSTAIYLLEGKQVKLKIDIQYLAYYQNKNKNKGLQRVE